MFVIDLRRADGSKLPFQLSIEPASEQNCRLKVVEHEATVCEAEVPYGSLPLSSRARDLRGESLALGYEPINAWVLVEFGEDARLAMLPAHELRFAANACRWLDRAFAL